MTNSHNRAASTGPLVLALACVALLAVVSLTSGSEPVLLDPESDRPGPVAGGPTFSTSALASVRLPENRQALPDEASSTDRELPTGPRAAALSPLEEDSYEITRSVEQGEYQALNHAQGLQIRFSSQGIQVRPREPDSADWELGMRLSGIGYGNRRQRVLDRPLHPSGNRADYGPVRSNGTEVTQWYVNSPRGLEQGFTLPAPPAFKEKYEDHLVLEFALSGGLIPSVSRDGREIGFTRPDGVRVLRYRELHTFDALGRALPSRMELRNGKLALVVDDRDAPYPLTVDSLVTTQQAN